MTEYLVFIDESGTPNMEKIDPQYPVFGVGALVFEKEYFFSEILPYFEKLKEDHGFSRDTILHSREIRQQEGVFSCLVNYEKRMQFLEGISAFFDTIKVTIISSIIKTRELKERYESPGCPYDLSFLFILERLEHFLRNRNSTAHLILERREENVIPLQAVFSRLKEFGNGFLSGNGFQKVFPQEKLEFVGKENVGVQMADLAIYPLTTKVFREKKNVAFEVLSQKFYGGNFGNTEKYGYKIFP